MKQLQPILIKLIYVILASSFLSCGIAMNELSVAPGLKRLIEEERHAALYRLKTIIREGRGDVRAPAPVLERDEVKTLLEKFHADGVYKSNLPLTNITPEVLKNKNLPSPNKKEARKYVVHAHFLDELYELARASQLNPELIDDTKLVDLIFNSLSWYMEEKAPERPYWRVTMRFGGLNRDKLQGTSILFYLDRILMTLAPEIEAAKLNGDTSRIILCRNVTDYTDHLIELAVGAQNRGPNWQGRLTQLTCHYILKYLCGDKGALNQLKHHLYDGFEYDPDRLISKGMGPLPDGGFWHHGPQPYCLPYALIDYYGAMALMKRLEGSPLEFLPKHYQTYETQMLDKWQYVIFNDQWFDLSIVGGKNACQVVHYKARVEPGTLENMLDNMLELDPSKFARFEELKALKNTLTQGNHDESLSINRNFWHWEYMLHRRNGWYIGFKGMSNRTKSCEWDQNFHLTSGHTAIMHNDGDEYWRVRPALKWTALPGTTAEQVPSEVLIGNDSSGMSSFANGVSDGQYGLFAFEMEPNNLKAGSVWAKKGGFFFDHGMVALTSKIRRETSGFGNEVWTTLDQRQRKGKVSANVNGTSLLFKEEEFEKNLILTQNAWFLHDGIGYMIPVQKGKPVTIKISSKTRSGKVVDVLPHNKAKAKYKATVFLLAINHGVEVDNESAAYYVLPDTTEEALNDFLAEPPYQIIRNDEKCQVVMDPASGIVQCAFYKSDTVKLPGMFDLTATLPSFSIFKLNGNKLAIHASRNQAIKRSREIDDFKIHRHLVGKFSKYMKKENFTKVYIPYRNKEGYEGSTVSLKLKLKEF